MGKSTTQITKEVRATLRADGIPAKGIDKLVNAVMEAVHAATLIAWGACDYWRAFSPSDPAFERLEYSAQREAAARAVLDALAWCREAHAMPAQRPLDDERPAPPRAARSAPRRPVDGVAVWSPLTRESPESDASERVTIGRAWVNADGSVTLGFDTMPLGAVARTEPLAELVKAREAAAALEFVRGELRDTQAALAEAREAREAEQRERYVAACALTEARRELEAERRDTARLRELVQRLTDENDAARNALRAAAQGAA